MTDSAERIVVNFGDVDLSDVCLVVGNTDFNVHKMVLASRSSCFKALFFGDFKEKHEKRITIEADPAPFHRMLELLYEGRCANKDFFKCSKNFPEVFWKEGVPLWELLGRYDVKLGQKYFEKNLEKYFCQTTAYLCRKCAFEHISYLTTTCPCCVLRKIFAMQHGIDLDVFRFELSAIQTAVEIAREKKIVIEADTYAGLILYFVKSH